MYNDAKKEIKGWIGERSEDEWIKKDELLVYEWCKNVRMNG